MIDEIKTGGPPFPVIQTSRISDFYSLGMTLRDWFATHASDQDIEDRMHGTTKTRDVNLRQKIRYGIADAMLAERSKAGAV